MGYSAPQNELPLLVFTNSRDDYRVTVCSAAKSAANPLLGAARWVDALARRCDAWFARGGSTVLGVVPSPDRPGHALAVRVFDVGEFRGRPHTLAIVAVELPPGWFVGRSAARLLAALAPPMPDATEYQLPTHAEIQAAPITAEPFASLDAWQSARQSELLAKPMMFSNPPDFARELNRGGTLQSGGVTPKRQHNSALRIVIGIVVVAVGAAFAWKLFTSSAVVEKPVEKSIGEAGYSREQLLACLAKSGVQLLPGVTDQQAAIAVVETAPVLEQRMGALADELAARRREPSPAILPVVLHQQSLWMAPVQAAPSGTASTDSVVLSAAMAVHKAYQDSRRILDELAILSPDSAEFGQALENLRRALSMPRPPPRVGD